jgi:hypothetical protein
MAGSINYSRKVRPIGNEAEAHLRAWAALSSYNTYSQFKPPQMEAFVLELVALEIAHHAGGGLTNYERTSKRWTELIWDVDELKRILAEDKLHNKPVCRKFLLALEEQDKIAPRKGVRQIIRIYGISPGNCHRDNGVQWLEIGVYMSKVQGSHWPRKWLLLIKCFRHRMHTVNTYCFATLLDHLRSSYPEDVRNLLSSGSMQASA